MTPQDRARLIVEWFHSDTPEEGDLGFVETQISEAVEEARSEEHALRIVDVFKASQEARCEAFEEAAKIAEQRPTGASDDGIVVQQDIAATIRALKPKSAGPGEGK